MKNRLLILVIIYTLSCGTVVPHILNNVYPATSIVFTLGIIILLGLSLEDHNIQATNTSYLSGIIVLAVGYRVRVFTYPASMIGIDPDGYAVQMARVMATGDTSVITFGFYRRAPLHILEGAITGLVTGLSSPAASVVYPLVAGVSVPLLAAVFARQLRPNSPRTVLFAAAGASLLGYSVHYSYWPIAQTTGVLLQLFTIFAIFAYIMSGDRRWLAISLTTMLGAVYTHKLSAITTTLSVGGALVLGVVHPQTRHSTAVKRLAGGTILALGLFTAWQLFYATGLFTEVIFRGLGVLGAAEPSAPFIPTAAYDPYTFPHRLFRLSYVLILGASSGLVWIFWLWRTNRASSNIGDVLFLGLVAPLAGLVPVLFPAGVNAVRTIFYSEVLLVVLVSVGWYWYTNESPVHLTKVRRYAAVTGILLIITTAGISPIAGPDYQPLNRNYLTSEEVSTKEWGYGMVHADIATDQYFAGETPPSRIAKIGEGSNVGVIKFNASTEMYLYKEIRKRSPSVIAHRSCIENFRSQNGIWKLTYNPTYTLNQYYNRVFDSGCVQYFLDSSF